MESRFSVVLPSALARKVEKYAEEMHTSRSRAIASLVRVGLEIQEQRKREFLKRLRAILAMDDPQQEDRLVDEFWDLMMGR